MERWRDIPGYEGLYQVSTLGRVRRWFKLKQEWKIKTIRISRKGRPITTLSIKGRRDVRQISHLVLETFVGPRPDGMFACHHPDSNVLNNKLANLRWDTRRANERDRLINSLGLAGQSIKVVYPDGTKATVKF